MQSNSIAIKLNCNQTQLQSNQLQSNQLQSNQLQSNLVAIKINYNQDSIANKLNCNQDSTAIESELQSKHKFNQNQSFPPNHFKKTDTQPFDLKNLLITLGEISWSSK